MNKNILKGIGAVVAGFITVVILSIGTDFVLETLGIFPPASQPELFGGWMLVVALAYRSVYAVIGGYVTARLAPNPTMRYVVILGILGLIGGIMGVIAGRNLSAHWYPVALAATAFPCVWVGGKLRKPQQSDLGSNVLHS